MTPFANHMNTLLLSRLIWDRKQFRICEQRLDEQLAGSESPLLPVSDAVDLPVSALR